MACAAYRSQNTALTHLNPQPEKDFKLMTDTINDNLSLTVINDNAGDQCGVSYKERCEVFLSDDLPEGEKAAHVLDWVISANTWMIIRGYESVTMLDIFDQAAKVSEYYVDHVTELAKGA